ncbi:MAG: hypothetical protein RBR71_10050 [Gudongella sp.]|nr:hypothetical protein [Gudongella sp.]
MNKKTKAFLSMLFMSLTFYMMIETTYVNAVGDYVIEFIGLKSWTGNYTGTHLTIYYFMPLFIIGIILVKKYAIHDLKIKWKIVIIVFIGLNTIFALSTEAIAKNIKANSEGLLSIGLEQEDSNHMEYEFKDGKYTKFTADIKLTNYSKEDKQFHLVIDNKYLRNPIRLYNLDGSRAIFKLKGEETKMFSINLDNYLVKDGNINKNDYGNVAGSGDITGVIIFDDRDDEVKIDNNNFFGISLKK